MRPSDRLRTVTCKSLQREMRNFNMDSIEKVWERRRM
ncbi:hypothetical protein GBF38_012081 [Nibea albiflora]|uniref:Uncharacterized protein n=1 Tax=Nibea albiflora TaxID=240163 RepID=A0ACB7EIW4_NIBAL|nr:hypothetical protein GBF38_012081 [Nibea albiflora]